MGTLQIQESFKISSSIKQQATFARESISSIHWQASHTDMCILRTLFLALSFREASKIIHTSHPGLIPLTFLTASEDFISNVLEDQILMTTFHSAP